MADSLGRLAQATLPRAGAVSIPAYDRARVEPGIVHLGVGAFHRAHQAVYVDDCLAAGETGWGIAAASLRSPETRDALSPQDGLYTLAVQDAEAERLRVIGSIREFLVAPENPAALVARLADPRTRLVSLTVTEKAYGRRADGSLDLALPDIAWDIANPDRPRTAHGFLAAGLAARRKAGLPPFTVLCCDNLPANGATLRRLMLQFAQAQDAALARFIETDVAFPSTMVDRIVPATTDEDRQRISQALGLRDAWPVVTEPFLQWVVEDRFTAGRPGWERFGVTMTGDVAPFEEMKLRLLNGAHSAIAYLGLLLGHETVAAAFGDPAVRSVIDGLWAESAATLPQASGLDPHAYMRLLAHRFANPALKHRLAQIANDGSQKLPQRMLTPLFARLAGGEPAGHLSLGVAAWIAACETRGESLALALFTDPLDGGLRAIFARRMPAGETVDAVFRLAGFAAGDRLDPAAVDSLRADVARFLQTIRDGGARAAIDAAVKRLTT